LATDLPRIVEQVLDSAAQDFVFLEIDTIDLQTRVPTIKGGNSVWYLINVASNLAEVDTLLEVIKNPRAFMYEFDPTVQMGDLVARRLNPAGIRSFTYEDSPTASEQQLREHYARGHQVVSANTVQALVQARQAVNQSRGVSPP